MIGHLVIYGTIIFFWKFINNFLELLIWKIYVFDIQNTVNFFSDFYYIAKCRNSDRIKLSVETVYVKHPYGNIP